MYTHRSVESKIQQVLKSGKSILLLGPRQTGKTTLINRISAEKRFTLANPKDRLRYEMQPDALSAEVEALDKPQDRLPLVIIDEIQKVPILMDAVQDLIDRKIAQFILTGSSARKLRRGGNINLLPGRVVPLRLDPFTQIELVDQRVDLQTLLLDGALPEILLEKKETTRESLLDAYVTIYLEEEIRSEAIVRDVANFARFLEFASAESGKVINFNKLSQEIGVTHMTIASYYQILEDCLIAERIAPLTTSATRRKLTKAQKYLFYDLGVRRIAAHEGRLLSKDQMGSIFEQYIGLELIRMIRANQQRYAIHFWRDPAGPEIDWVIDTHEQYIPIEVKLTTKPTKADAKHLHLFLSEYSQATHGYIICQTPHVMKISDNVTALPWDHLQRVWQ